MYTVPIGKSFLKLYNAKTGAKLSAKAFFDEVMWPLFFNSADDKHLMQVSNSDFFQNYSKQAASAGVDIPVYRRNIFHEKVSFLQEKAGKPKLVSDPYCLIDLKKDYGISGAIVVGYWAGGPAESTYGQVSDLQQTPDGEDIYCSWIGGGLGVGFGGGYDFLFDEPAILWHIYLGWKYYRQLIEETPNLKGRQINGWNGLWLTYGIIGDENAASSWASVSKKIPDYIKDGTPKVLERPDWPEQILSLSKSNAMKSQNIVIAQGFSFGSTNKTLGIIPIAVPEVRNLGDMWEYLLNLNSEMYSDQEAMLIEKHLANKYSMERAVQTGGLGLRALTPKDVETLFSESRKEGSSSIDQLEKVATKKKTAYLYNLTWILAMAQITLPNNEDLLQIAETFSQELMAYYDRGNDRTSTKVVKGNNIGSLFDSSHKAAYLKALADIIDDRIDEPAEVYNKVKQMVTIMPMEHYRLFVAVLRCSYVYCKVGGKLTARS